MTTSSVTLIPAGQELSAGEREPELKLPGNIKTLTGVRGFAALWVVLFHIQGSPFSHISLPAEFIKHGFWGVDVFFVLSGFVLSHVYERSFAEKIVPGDYFHYQGLRLARIYPLHLVTFVAAFACYILSVTIGHGTAAAANFGFHEAIMNLTLLHAWGTTKSLSWNDVSWSISAEWFAYLFLLVPCIRLLRNVPLKVLYTIAAISWCLVIFVYLPVRTSNLLDMTYDFGILRMAPEFLGGYVAYQSARAIRRNPIIGDLACLAGLVGIVFVASQDTFQALLLPVCMLFLVGLSMEGPVGSFFFGNRIAMFLGEVSYSIYMCHVLVLMVIDGVVKRLPLPQTLSWFGAGIAVGSLIAIIVTSHCLYILVERPCRKWARIRLERRLAVL
jgi:peptidoglycan/LPS O-acetylase OafA/YrhL